METLLTTLTIIALIICLVVLIYKSKPIQELLKAKLNQVQFQTIADIVKSWVGYAKQWLTSYTGAEKKAFVLEKVVAKAKENGINITYEELDALIESSYGEIKDTSEK